MGLLDRVNEAVCHRAFSGPEAVLYEGFVAAGVLDCVGPAIEAHVRGPRVLDVGCGGGLLAERLRAQGHEVVGVDPSRSQVRRARRAGHRVVAATAGSLPFADGSFDTVVSSCAIKHWPDIDRGVAECLRVLRPDGVLVVVEIDAAADADTYRRFTARTRVPRPLQSGYVRFALATVVPVSLGADQLRAAVGAPAQQIGDLPFLVAVRDLGSGRE